MLQSLQSCPRHLLVCEKSNFLQEKSRHSAHVETHYFNCSASVLLPECGSLPEQIKNTIESFGNYYVVKNLPLYEFITQDFINKFIKKGSFYALSYQTRIDQDNTAALLPTGKLLISVAKDTYEELGLQGKPSLYSGKHAMRYIVSVDLTDRSLTTEGKKFQRVHWCLAEKKPLAFDFLLASDNEETPSILSYFSKYDIKECPYKVSSTISRNLHCPVIKSGQLQGSPGESCGSEELFEWLGAVSNNIDCNNESSSFISAYCCPVPNTIVEQAHLCTITGFITPNKINQILLYLREYFAEPKLAPWVSLMVHGFADSPVSWKENEHGFCKGGENLYSFVVFNNQDYWIHMAVGTFDGCPP
ncbi:ribonuclease P protein subunit p40 isoform X1 [Spea bombifrons]|uniref:ribonuclease P protein subunit p40 isoform X1 n=1 Tax=Spea bombifrons TaxID=233779 RepID=UPI00234B955C|nr:ribonuclease P protein subunit p40 isoform X1 [Spea bombifrons]